REGRGRARVPGAAATGAGAVPHRAIPRGPARRRRERSRLRAARPSGTARAYTRRVTQEMPAGDTTKIIPPPRRGPRGVDLLLAAVAGSLVTVLAIVVLFLGNRAQVLPTSSSPSPSASASASASPTSTIRISVPTTAPPTDTPSATT